MIADQLRRRARSHGGDPLVTYYDLGSGERTELSATSFLNWVDKTSNLLVDELLLEPGAVIELELARMAPGHWVTLVIALASWQVGATVRMGGQAAAPADLLVLGPDWADHDRSRADSVLACTLHPLGLGFAAALPSDVMDFSTEVRGQSDQHLASPRQADELAWVDDQRQLSQNDLVIPPPDQTARRLVVQTTDPWLGLLGGCIVPIITGGSAVVVVGTDQERLARIVETERVDSIDKTSAAD